MLVQLVMIKELFLTAYPSPAYAAEALEYLLAFFCSHRLFTRRVCGLGLLYTILKKVKLVEF